ncbi:catechol 2,3-dioxygenase-like lactoylglutathione lyase family enzyme [Streptosporangium album]|uniref:Catechol 2,3-dioxygenase-like lactoylglutathione lyase family enzyme n=1 Tax=Streptosporangium album TaxID=47479 RepID=A0A7W7WEI8_9ACTN|nr:VOC family protein [Streptosporangium album]MBB4944176.1 catechol 2,3-dioxygenase-like lactoylglutathione lyase family enzyme [Streptosporangium album]
MFKIGKFFHAIHVVADLDRADIWYDQIFGGRRFYRGHLPVEKRDASLLVIADFCVEPMMSSRVPGAERTPVGRFYSRFGQRLHSLAWYVTDLPSLYERLRSAGIRVTGPGGTDMETGDFPGSLYTHPRDSHSLIEFVDMASLNGALRDPRLDPAYSPAYWRDEHPLGIERVSHMTVVVRDLHRATSFYAGTLDGDVVGHSDRTPAGTRSVYVAVGEDSIIELARPHSDDSLAGRDLAENGEIMHSVTFKVRDLAAAEQHLAANGVRIAERQGDDVVLHPDDCFGAVLRLTQGQTPGETDRPRP